MPSKEQLTTDLNSLSPDQAKSMWHKALQLSGSFRFALIFLGVSYSLSATLALIYISATISSDNCKESQKLYEDGKYNLALQKASLAALTNPLSAEASFQRGQVYAKRMMYKEAVKNFDQALFLNANLVKALDARSVANLKIGHPQQTVLDIEKISTIAPASVKAYQLGNLAAALYQLGQYAQALAIYDKALVVGGRTKELLIGKIYCLLCLGKTEMALNLSNAALKIHKDESELLCQQGYCYQLKHQNQKALANYNLAIENAPGNSRWYTYRANLYLLENKQEALQDYKKALSLNPLDHQLLGSAAQAALKLKDYNQAFNLYQQLSMTPEFKKSRTNQEEYAAVCLRLSKYEDALKGLDLALEKQRLPNLLIAKANCLTKLGKLSQAKEYLLEAEKSNPDKASLLLAKAQISKLSNDLISAIDAYSNLLLIQPCHAQALKERGECYLAKGQLASALTDFKQAQKFGAKGDTLQQNLKACQGKLTKIAAVNNLNPVIPTLNLKKYSSQELIAIGYQEHLQGNNLQAISFLEEAVKRQPSNILPRRYLAHSLKAAGLNNEACQAFQTLASIEPLNRLDKTAYALSLAALSSFPQAIAIMKEVRQENPGDQNATFQLAKILSASGARQEALELCRTTLSSNGPGSNQLKGLYNSLMNQKQEETATSKIPQAKPDTEG